MAGQQHLELSHKVKGQSETNAMGRAKCELKHQHRTWSKRASKRGLGRSEGGGLLSSGGSNPN